MLNPDCISFEHEGHIYRHIATGRVVPSVTQVISTLGGYDHIDPVVLQYAADRGTAVHTACELLDENDLDYGSLAPAIQPYVDAWELFRNESGFIPEVVEALCWHESWNYCGRIDRIGKFNHTGKSTIIDIKTSRYASLWTWGMQLAAYAEAAGTNEPHDRAVVHLKDDGTYSYYKFKQYSDWKYFKIALDFYNLKNEISRQKNGNGK